MAKREELETVLSAVDKASKIIDGVADSAEKLEGMKPEVEVDADDKASTKLDGVEKDVKALDGKDAEVVADADDNASDPLADIRAQLNTLDGDTAEVLLKAEARDAKRDVSAIQREIIALDGEDASVLIEAKDNAKARLDAIQKELADLDSTVAEPKIEADDAGGSGLDAGAAFGLNAIKGIGLAGIGSAIVAAFNAGMDKIKVRAQMVAQFGLVKDDAERLSKEAADIYAGNWGDSMGEVSTAVGLVQRDLVETGAISEAEMGKIAEGAIVMSDAFGVDVSEVIRSVSQLMLNGLAPDAETAMDQMTVAMQGGVNKADDLFDTIDEYSQHVAAMGLSSEDLFAILSDGMANGQRDTDKLGDAVKEMFLKTTSLAPEVSQAYQDLNLDAEEYRTTLLAGGPAAREAYQEILNAIQSVEDPIKRNDLAIALIGTQLEDLGPTGIDSMLAIEGATVDVTGALDEVNKGLSDSASEFDKLARQAKAAGGVVAEDFAGEIQTEIMKLAGDLELLGELLEAMAGNAADEDDGVDWLQKARNVVKYSSGVGLLATQLDNARKPAEWLGLAADELTGSIDESTDAMKRGSQATVQGAIDAALKTKADEKSSGAMVQASIDAALLGDATDDKAMSDEEAAEAAAAHKESLRAQIDALVESAEAIYDQVDAKRSAADATFALNDAEDDFIETLATSSEAIAANDGDLRAVRQAMDDAAISAGKVADAEIRVAEETAAASGATLTATEKLDIQNESMLNSAATAEGPLRAAILGYIGDVNGIPDEQLTDIQALIDEGKIEEAEALLNDTSRARVQTTRAEADIAKAEGDLNYVARDRTANVRGNYVGGGQIPGLGSVGYRHAGGYFNAPTPGGEGLAMLRDGERVVTPEGKSDTPAAADWKAIAREMAREFARTMQQERRAM